jgi:hypothetical protein
MAMSAVSDYPIKTQTRTIDGLSIRYAESGVDCEVDALLVSPWPEEARRALPLVVQLSHLAGHAGGACFTRFPGLGAGSARTPSRDESRGRRRAAWTPCSPVRAAPPLTRTRSQSGMKQEPAECRQALLLLVVRSASQKEVWRGARIAVKALVSGAAQRGLTPDTGT